MVSEPRFEFKVPSLSVINQLKKYSSFRFDTCPSETSSSLPSSFTSKRDLTSCPVSIKISFRVSSFENHTSAVVSVPESVNSTDHEEYLHNYDPDDPSISIGS